jgi:hypothetical protein
LVFGFISEIRSTETAAETAVGTSDETSATEEEAVNSTATEEQELTETQNTTANPENAEETEGTPGEQAGSRINNSQRNRWGSRLRNMAKFVSRKANTTYKRLSAILRSSVGTVQMTEAFAQGGKGLIEAKWKAEEALRQSDEGRNAAVVEQLRTESSLANQRSEQSNSLWQRAGQDFDTALSILRSAADNITSTVDAMFRG